MELKIIKKFQSICQNHIKNIYSSIIELQTPKDVVLLRYKTIGSGLSDDTSVIFFSMKNIYLRMYSH